MSAYIAKGNDTHNRSETISITGDLYVYEIPKSPISIPFTQTRYLSSLGLSKPNSFLRASNVSS